MEITAIYSRELILICSYSFYPYSRSLYSFLHHINYFSKGIEKKLYFLHPYNLDCCWQNQQFHTQNTLHATLLFCCAHQWCCCFVLKLFFYLQCNNKLYSMLFFSFTMDPNKCWWFKRKRKTYIFVFFLFVSCSSFFSLIFVHLNTYTYEFTAIFCSWIRLWGCIVYYMLFKNLRINRYFSTIFTVQWL